MKISLKYLLGILFLALLTGACRSTRYVSFNSELPPEIIFSEEIQDILIVDRSAQTNEDVNIIEGVVTGELPGEDKRGAGIVLNAYKRQVESITPYKVHIYPHRLSSSGVIAELRPAAPWSLVEELATEAEADIVVMIESFDSNTRLVRFNSVARQQENSIAVGMRMYDPVTRKIVDQQMLKQRYRQSASPNTPFSIPKDISDRSASIANAAENAARNYALKLAPKPFRIRRMFYSRGKRDREVDRGARYGDVGDWTQAMEVWKNALPTTRRRKDAGRLSYNIAVAYEVLGDLEKAIEYASISFTDYRNDEGRDYIRKLRRRRELGL